MTLLEVLIVVALIALLSGGILMGSGFFSSQRLQAAAGLVAGSVRAGITQSTKSGRSVRLVLDLDADSITLEEAEGKMLRDRKVEGDPSAGAEPATELERATRDYAKEILEGPHAPRAQFHPVEGPTDVDDAAKGRTLGTGIHFVKVQTEHDDLALEHGRAYLYFFPGGGTERASIQITREGDEEGFTILVSALTGRAKVERGHIDLPESRGVEEYSEREDQP